MAENYGKNDENSMKTVPRGNALLMQIQKKMTISNVEYVNAKFILPVRSFQPTRYSFVCNTKPENTNAEIVWLSSQN